MEKTGQNYIIAIDGGAASGKSTIAKGVARQLNFVYIDTGAMYRAATLYFVQNNIELTPENIISHIEKIHIAFEIKEGNLHTILNGNDVSDELHSSKISSLTPIVAKVSKLRERMLMLQREFATENNIVMDGRDITSVVFPNATLKIYVTASLDERARRRKIDFDKRGENLSIETIKQDLLKRDEEDSNRKDSPLIKVKDAIEVDTTNNTIDKNVSIVLDLFKKRIEA
ncbi:MAG: (d)CMP kinase [Clostridia bacterium]|nr:(d)CMP kinase [Clostridia bacterium]